MKALNALTGMCECTEMSETLLAVSKQGGISISPNRCNIEKGSI